MADRYVQLKQQSLPGLLKIIFLNKTPLMVTGGSVVETISHQRQEYLTFSYGPVHCACILKYAIVVLFDKRRTRPAYKLPYLCGLPLK